MQFRRMVLLTGVLYLAAVAQAQQPGAQVPAGSTPVIRTETKLVLVDVVVTGKKGVYVEDLEMKNFKVWEDNKEQQLKTFSFGADPNGPGGQKHKIDCENWRENPRRSAGGHTFVNGHHAAPSRATDWPRFQARGASFSSLRRRRLPTHACIH